MNPLDERRQKQLEELRLKHPDRRAYIDGFTGVPVVGPTLDEVREMSDALREEERAEAARLMDPAVALDFVRECNGEPTADPVLDTTLGAQVASVEEVLAATASFSMRRSGSSVVARITLTSGERTFVLASSSSFAGSGYEPPDSEATADRITEEKAVELRTELRTAWERKP